MKNLKNKTRRKMERPKKVEKNIPKIICLCGSTKFKYEYRILNRLLTIKGKIVLSVGGFFHVEDYKLTEKQKEKVDKLHLQKIDLADMVFIINPDNYIGKSTERELEYAKRKLKDIYYFTDEPDILDKEEYNKIINGEYKI